MYERYKLSAQYNLQKLMDVYLDSIMLEVREYDHILHNVLRKAQFSYPDEKTIHMCVEDTVLARGKMPELTRILEKIIGERCGLDVVLQEEYRVPEETGRKEEEERRIEMEVAQIAARMKGASGEEGQEAQPAAGTESKSAAGGAKGGAAPSEGGAARRQWQQIFRWSEEGRFRAPGQTLRQSRCLVWQRLRGRSHAYG